MSQLPGGLPHRTTRELLEGLEGERVIPLPEAGRMNSISVDTIMREHSDKVVRVSPGRLGMKLKDVLAIAQPINVT
jgi:hypothetical protein